MGRFMNLDARAQGFFEQELEHVKEKTYDKEYPEIRFRRFCPVTNDTPNGAESIAYYQFDQVGMAKLIKDYAHDLPTVDVFGTKHLTTVESIGVSFIYSLQEIRAAQQAGRPLQERKATSTRRVHEMKNDILVAFGDDETGLPGMLNNAAVPVGTALTGAWASATADEILDDMAEAANTMFSATNSVEMPDTILLPPEQYALIAHKRVPDSNKTVLQQFLDTSPFINEVDQWHHLTGAGAAGADRMLTYRKDPEVLEAEIPQEFEMMPAQEVNLSYKVPCHSRTGGCVIRRPLAMQYRDGI